MTGVLGTVGYVSYQLNCTTTVYPIFRAQVFFSILYVGACHHPCFVPMTNADRKHMRFSFDSRYEIDLSWNVTFLYGL